MTKHVVRKCPECDSTNLFLNKDKGEIMTKLSLKKHSNFSQNTNFQND